MAETKKITIPVYNQLGEKISTMSLKGEVFAVEVHETAVFDAINVYLANMRQATSKTKKRDEVSGGGKKPWRQKGTGNARAGSSRSPIWVGGGVTFGPTSQRNYSKRMNNKERQQALMMIFAAHLENLLIIDKIEVKEPKTQKALEILNKLPLLEGEITLFCDRGSKNSTLAFRNLPYLKLMSVKNIDALKIGEKGQLLFEQSEFKAFTEIYDHDK